MTIKEVCSKYNITPDTIRYYEKVGVIPTISRTNGGTRIFTEEDILWIENAVCMRSSGVSIEAIIEYVRLYQMGDSTFKERRELLNREREKLIMARKNLNETISRLEFKISKYDEAIKTGVLKWEE